MLPSKAKRFFVLINVSVLIGLASAATPVDMESLGKAGREAYAKHQRLFNDVVPNYPVETKVQVNSGLKALTQLAFFKGPLPIDGTAEIAMPFELNEHLFDFVLLELTGRGMDGITRVVVDSGGGGNPVLGIVSQQKERVQIKVTSFMCAVNVPLTLRVEGRGAVVEQVALIHREGIAMEFDASIYREPGLDKPIQPVSIAVDATQLRSIEGICDIKRERYFRYYAAPNSDRSGKEPYFKGKGFLPGRQVEQIGPAYEDRWGAAASMPCLKEDPARPGYADPAFFERREFWRFEGVDPDLEFMMSFDDWPRFMWPTNLPGVVNQRGTPAEEYFEAAADLAVQLLKAQIRDSGRTANWWEVKNESDVKSEWIYHHQRGFDGWKLLADFHNIMADAIHTNVPGIKVGGPVSAWFVPYANDFEVWRNQARFMDMTRDHLDFYSHHFYEVGSMDTFARVKQEGHSFIQGGLECTVDMLRAYMAATGNNKPMTCSEYGSLSFVRDERGFWIHIKNINAMLLNFLGRPHDFEITVPFMLTFMHWAPDSLETFIHQTPDGEFVKTKNAYLLDMWEGFKGKRIPVTSSAAKVPVHAVLDGDTIRLVVNNRSGQRADLSVASLLPEGRKVVSIKRRIISFEKGETRYAHESLHDLNAIPLGVDVTVILEIQLDQAPVLERVVEERFCYAREVAVNINGSARLTLPVDAPQELSGAVLRVGLYRKGGFPTPVSIRFNGETLPCPDLAWSVGTPQFFDYVEIPLDLKMVRADNELVVETTEAGATVTAARLTLSKQKIGGKQP